MKTTVALDPELECELQELYMLSNHWISDIQFVEHEIRFLKNILHKYLVPALKNDQLIEMETFNKTLTRLNADIPVLKNKILDLLKFIGPYLIDETNTEINLSLLEKFTALETEIKALFENVKQVKRLLFSFIEEIMKSECTVFIDHL